MARWPTAGVLRCGAIASVLTACVVGSSVGWPATAEAVINPDTCIRPYVWREAFPLDHVCVTPQVRADARADNEQAAARRLPDGTCRSGWVWREARPNDHVCVVPPRRDQASADYREITRRWADLARPDGGYTPHPFHLGGSYSILSSSTSPRLVADVIGASFTIGQGVQMWPLNDSQSQRFRFVAPGGGRPYRNVFQIVVAHSSQCLKVAVAGEPEPGQVVQARCTQNPNYLWAFRRRTDGQHELRALHFGKCLDAAKPGGGTPGQGARLQHWTCSGTQNQAWRLLSRV